ncbi:MAG: hypothetical protein ACOZNI_17705 [Myxococcota bacterium]
MDLRVQDLLRRLAREPAFADAFFADPDAHLAALDLPEADRAALRALDREAVLYLDVAAQQEPAVAPEHAAGERRWATPAIALWACAAFVVLWLLTGGGR